MSKYEDATFQIRIGAQVRVEVSLHGCSNPSEYVAPEWLRGAGETCIRLAQAIEEIKRDIEEAGEKR